MLEALIAEVQAQPVLDGPPPPVLGPTPYQCVARQALQRVGFGVSAVVLVLAGSKTVWVAGRCHRVAAGELLLLPALAEPDVVNEPGTVPHRGVVVRFEAGLVAAYQETHGVYEAHAAARWTAPAPAEVVLALLQWFQWQRFSRPDGQWVAHRTQELLRLLVGAGLAGNLLQGPGPDLRQQLVAYMRAEPTRLWQVDEVARSFGQSESTLRRRLREQGTGFRDLLEEARLSHGLQLLQSTRWPVARVALASGYQSQSRFSERFKLRFGMLPGELRRSTGLVG